MHIAQRFEYLLDSYRHSDGSQWTGQQIDEATEGLVTRSYFVNLRKGRIRSPGHDKLAAIVKAMGFPPEAWFEESANTEQELDWGLSGALRDEAIRDTVREMSRLSRRERRLVLGIASPPGPQENRPASTHTSTSGTASRTSGPDAVSPTLWWITSIAWPSFTAP